MIPYWIKWDEFPWEHVNDQIDRKVVVRDRLMMVMYRFAPHLAWPEERHEAEQGGYIIRGSLELTLPDENKTIVLHSGDGYLIASMARHSWRTLDDGALFVDVFSPPRAELMYRKFAPNADV
jgi:quercetin dioxygenase-like cupin family protein